MRMRLSIEGTLNATIYDLGGCLYRVIFDTEDEAINAIVDDIELYSFYIEMILANRISKPSVFAVVSVKAHVRVLLADLGLPLIYMTKGNWIPIKG